MQNLYRTNDTGSSTNKLQVKIMRKGEHRLRRNINQSVNLIWIPIIGKQGHLALTRYVHGTKRFLLFLGVI